MSSVKKFRNIVLLAILLVATASSLFAEPMTQTLHLRAYVAPKTSISLDINGNMIVEANHDDFTVTTMVHDEFAMSSNGTSLAGMRQVNIIAD